MNLTQLQKQIETLTDEINDIFHATELNFDAIKIHLQIEQPQFGKNHQKPSASLIKSSMVFQCQKQFQKLKQAYKQRSNLRLQYLINEQIKSQEEKVRKQRLLEYEDKIYDHRRLICDKESFYDTLLKPKTKKPAGMTNEQFQEMRMKQSQLQEKNNFQQLEEETQLLLKLQKLMRNHRVHLEEQFEKCKNQLIEVQKMQQGNKECQLEVEVGVGEGKQNLQANTKPQQNIYNHNETQQKTVLKKTIINNMSNLQKSTPTLYSKIQITNLQSSKQKVSQLQQELKKYIQLNGDCEQLMKQYKQERQMYKYLKWQQKDLIQKYKKLQDEIKQIKERKKAREKVGKQCESKDQAEDINEKIDNQQKLGQQKGGDRIKRQQLVRLRHFGQVVMDASTKRSKRMYTL